MGGRWSWAVQHTGATNLFSPRVELCSWGHGCTTRGSATPRFGELPMAERDGSRSAVAVPTVENGLWRVHPDGRMETTWQINPAARLLEVPASAIDPAARGLAADAPSEHFRFVDVRRGLVQVEPFEFGDPFGEFGDLGPVALELLPVADRSADRAGSEADRVGRDEALLAFRDVEPDHGAHSGGRSRCRSHADGFRRGAVRSRRDGQT